MESYRWILENYQLIIELSKTTSNLEASYTKTVTYMATRVWVGG